MTDMHILLVDDSTVVRMVIAKQLEKLGLAIDVAGDGLEAVAKVKDNHYDIIFMDIMMPRMDGLEATKQIRQIEQIGDLKKSIIVGVTGYVNRSECIAAGMDDFMFKPVTIEQLKKTIKQWRPDWSPSTKPHPTHLFTDENTLVKSIDTGDERIAALRSRLGYDTSGNSMAGKVKTDSDGGGSATTGTDPANQSVTNKDKTVQDKQG